MQAATRRLGKWMARNSLYVAIMLTIYGAIRLDAMGGDTPLPPADRLGNALPESVEARMARLQEVSLFNDGGMVEAVELAILATIASVCVLIAMRHPDVRATSLSFGGLMAAMAVREQDYWFDRFAHGSWVVPAGLLAAGVAAYAWNKRRELWPGLVEFVHTPGWGIFVGGGLIVMVFSRLMGQKALWNHLVDSPRLARNLKNMVDESLETAGYALLLCSLIEGISALRARRESGPGM